MERTINLTESEMRQALDAAMGMVDIDEDGPDVFTTRQLAEMYGLGWQAASARAEAAVKRGVMEPLHVMRASTDGSLRCVKAYRLVTQ